MSQLVAARNTCFALISSIEDDFRSAIECIAEEHGFRSDLLPGDVRENASRRRSTDTRKDSTDANLTDSELLNYIDFSDISKILNSKIAALLPSASNWITETARILLKLTSTRNRVCHSRPLESDDLATLVEFAKRLEEAQKPFRFPSVGATLLRLEKEPAYILTLQIPKFWNDKKTIVHNNLPVPEFDETGFLGRMADRANVLKLLNSHYPVVTIVGEGGIGKTALALRCLYDIVDDAKCPFEAVVWISLKTSALTQAGVKALSGAITETLGLFSAIATELGMPKLSLQKTEDELIEEIAEYLELYKILIAIDNLETLSTGSLRNLLLRIPAQSKILLTSRIGVGEFEARYPLQPLDEKTASALFRAYARVLGSNQLNKLDEGNIKGFCRRLFNNPLLIKWFVAAVGLGAQPTALISTDRPEFSSALTFCFENLFDRLGKPERLLIDCIMCARKPLTSAELRFLAPQLTDLDVEVALSSLHNSSIVGRTKSGNDDFEYTLLESAQQFISLRAPPSADLFKIIQIRLRELRTILTGEAIREARYEFDPYFVRIGGGRADRIAGTYLRDALNKLHQGEVDIARQAVQDARRLAPNSAEAWRISALIEERSDEYFKANECYEQAIQLDANSSICRYCYAQFLSTDMEDLSGALEQFDAGLKLAPNAPPLLSGKAKTLMHLDRLDEAINIHEALLPSIHTRDRHWRLVTTDQAADCFRRVCHREWDKKEYETAKVAAKRALQLIIDSALRGDIDEKLLKRAAKVINEALSKRELITDSNYVEFILTTSEKLQDLTEGECIPIASEASWALRNLDISETYRKRLRALDTRDQNQLRSPNGGVYDNSNNLTNAITANLDPHSGTIHNIRDDYGFIQSHDGKRWYFHKNSLLSPDEWLKLTEGDNVAFSIGENKRGACATDVKIINPICNDNAPKNII